MKNFDNLILELYDKQNSKEYKTDRGTSFSCWAYVFNQGYSFNKISKEFLEKNIKSVDSLYITSDIEKFEKQILRNFYKNHSFDNNHLIIQTRMSEYKLLLKK